MQPLTGRVEQVGRLVPDGRAGVTLPGEPDSRLGDVERDNVEAEPGDVFGVDPLAAADDDGAARGFVDPAFCCPPGEQSVRLSALHGSSTSPAAAAW